MKLVCLRIAVEERGLREHLGERAADCPQVDCVAVGLDAKKDLWCAVNLGTEL